MTKRRKLSTCRYAYEATELLARQIRKKNKTWSVTTYPPMGIGATCSISVENEHGCLIGFLTIGYGEDHSLTYQTPTVTHTYPKGSIGEINGLNHVYKELPRNVDDVVSLVFAYGDEKSIA